MSKTVIASDLDVMKIAKYLFYNASDMSNMKLQRLLFFAYKEYYEKYQKDLFKDNFEAWIYGPVLPEVYNNFYQVLEYNEFENSINYFNDKEDVKKFLYRIIEKYDDFSAFELVKKIHQEQSWINARKGLGNFESSSKKMNIKENMKLKYINNLDKATKESDKIIKNNIWFSEEIMSDKPLVVVTGASSGIGKATAQIFLDAGFPVLAIARREQLLKELKGEKKVVAKVDVTNIKQIKSAIEKAEKLYGPTDLIVNNAGIMPLEKYAVQELQDKYDMIDVNLKGVINGIDAVLPGMIKRKHGTIINISSIAGRYVYDNHAVYSATKYAVNALTEGIRKEVIGSNIRFTLIEPGIVDTNLLNLTDNKAILDEYNDRKKNINGGLTSIDVAKVIFNVYNLPQEVNLKEVLLTHTLQNG